MDTVPVVSIFGPTAVGKSAVGELLRERLALRGIRTSGISADAYAVYKEIPIITGAQDLVAGDWLTVGSVSVVDEWSAGAFANTARPAIDAALMKGIVPVLVGGTGLYLQAALANLEMRSAVPEEVRKRVQARIGSEGTESLHSEIARIVPARAARIEPSDSHRIARALEAIEMGDTDDSGDSLWTSELRHPTLLFGLTMERAALRERISKRVDAMLAGGATDEVARAWDLGPSKTASAAIGMKEIPNGDFDAMKTRTHRFAKRQETWMRKLEHARLVDVTNQSSEMVVEEIIGEIDRYLAA